MSEPRLTAEVSRTALADYLHGLAERAVGIEEEGVLHHAAELVLLAADRRMFDARPRRGRYRVDE